jgi:DNA mismatch repair protein MutS
LKVGFNKVFGYYIEVSNSNSTPLPEDYVRKQTLTGAERYLTPELKEKEAIVLTAQERIAERELEILRALSTRVAEFGHHPACVRPGDRRSRCPVEPGCRSRRPGWRRPEVNAGLRLSIKGGRHPLVEHSLPSGVSWRTTSSSTPIRSR